MVRDISGLGSPPRADTRTTNQQTNTADKASTQPETTEKTVAKDDVELSKEVKSLPALTEKISKFPEVSDSRVTEIKAALEQGKFSIDNQRIADKLLANDDFF